MIASTNICLPAHTHTSHHTTKPSLHSKYTPSHHPTHHPIHPHCPPPPPSPVPPPSPPHDATGGHTGKGRGRGGDLGSHPDCGKTRKGMARGGEASIRQALAKAGTGTGRVAFMIFQWYIILPSETKNSTKLPPTCQCAHLCLCLHHPLPIPSYRMMCLSNFKAGRPSHSCPDRPAISYYVTIWGHHP